MASPLDGLQSFLHGLPDFSSPEALSPHQLNQATEIFVFSVIQFEPLQANHREEYDYITLLRTIYQLVAVPDSFLRLLFSFIVREEYFSRDDSVVPYPDLAQALSRFSDSTLSNELQKSLAAFADHLVEYFFLPLKVSGRRTPKPNPTSPTVTEQMLARLRQQCLLRDRHKCVISRFFDKDEMMVREERDGLEFTDDEGCLLSDDDQLFACLEVAHILPRALTSVSTGCTSAELNALRRFTHEVLDMFDPGILVLLFAEDCSNAITLTHHWHMLFANFAVSFEPVSKRDAPDARSYKIDYVNPDHPFRKPILPVTRSLFLAPDDTIHDIQPPSARILAVHHAISCILYLSGAGRYISNIIQKVEEADIDKGGSTPIRRHVSLKLNGWMDGYRSAF